MDWWKDPPVNRDATRDALKVSREEVAVQRAHLLFLCGLVGVICNRLVPPRTCDEGAERAVLGWLLSERCAAADFADLDAKDFVSPEHRFIFALGLELVETSARGELVDTIWADRGTVIHAAGLCVPDLAPRVEATIRRMPYPATMPQREIDLVAALGRAWSLVDEQFNVEPFEVERDV